MESIRIENMYQGRFIDAIKKEIAAVCKDVVERPGIDKDREVVIKVKVKPDYDAEMDMNYPVVNGEVTKKTPGVKLGSQRAQVLNNEVKVNSCPHFADPERAQMRLDDEKPGNVTPIKATK